LWPLTLKFDIKVKSAPAQLIITLGVNDEVSKCHEQDDTVCYGKITNLTLRSQCKVKGHHQWYATHRVEVVYLHAKYEKPIASNDLKEVYKTVLAIIIT
jgi:hypothetical protein